MVTGEAELGLSFRVLGPLEAWYRGERVKLGGPLQERVLATLLLEAGRVVPLPRLVEAAWDDDPPATAQHQVRKSVADLRRRVAGGPDILQTDGAGYRIVVRDEQLDLGMFGVLLARAREAVAQGRLRGAAEQLQEALALWRGPVLGGLGGGVVDSAAAVFEERRLAAAEQLIDIRIDAGEAAEAVGELRGLIAEHPLREPFRAKLMLALYHCGRQAEALEEYTVARRLLAEELGVDPGPELTRTYEGVLRNSPELAPPERSAQQPPAVASWVPVSANCTLPFDVADFTGRQAEMEAVLAGSTGGTRTGGLIAIDGMGGSGKTALAVHVAHRLAPSYPDGQLYLDLRGFTPNHSPVEVGTALDLLLRMLGVPGELIPEDVSGRTALWRTVTVNRRLLLVLDNAREEEQLRPLLPTGGSALVLVTSRVRLTDLDGADAVATDRMRLEDSVELLTRCIGAQRVLAEPEAVAALVELCGRLPLALRIASSRLRSRNRWSIQDLVDRLRDAESHLGELESGDRSVSATIALSIRALSDQHRLLFRQLGAHPGSDFDVPTVAALGDLSVSRADRLLEGLLDAHLVEHKSADRYTFHDLVRSYLRTLVAAEELVQEQARARLRLLGDYLVTSRAAADILLPGRRDIPLDLTDAPRVRRLPRDEAEALAWFDAERQNLVSSVQLAARARLDRHVVLLTRDLGNFLHRRGFLDTLSELDTVSLAAARRLGDPLLELSVLTSLAAWQWHLGRPRAALKLLGQALDLAASRGDTWTEADILSRMGTSYTSLGDYRQGLNHQERARELAEQLNDRRLVCWARISASSALSNLDRPEEAAAHAAIALALARELGDGDAEVFAHVNAANAANRAGEHTVALAHLKQASTIAERIHASDGMAVVLTRLCDTYVRCGAFDEALRHGRTAVEQARAVRRPALVAAAENLLGLTLRAQGDPEGALTHHRSALEAALKADAQHEIARARAGLGSSLHALGRAAEAWSHWEAAVELLAGMGLPEAARVGAELAAARTLVGRTVTV